MPEGIQVLCIDDEPVLLETAKHFLELRGDILVDTASSARAALDRISGKKYHIIVTDFQMPGMDGIEFLKRVRVTDKNIPIIILTGRGREEVVIKALNNGANFYLQKGGSPDSLYTELGHVIRQLAVMQRTQMTLAEQEQRFHDVQNANDLIQSISPEGRFLFVNKKWLDTLGYRESDLGRLTIFDIIHEDSLNHCREIFSRVIAGENVGIIEAAFRTSDGGKVYVEGMTSCRMVDGHCQYTRGIFKDITQKKEIEKGLFESENKFATVFKSNPVPLTLVAVSDGVFVDVNDAFLQCTGYERSDVIGKTSRELQFFPDEREYNRWVAALRQKKDLRNHEIACRVRNGEIRTCRFSSSIIMTASEPHILSTIEDITEQKAAESALHALVSGLVGTTGIESLDRIALSIHEWLGADCIMIGKILPDRENVRVLSMLLDGKKIEDYSYSLKGTPCENTAQKRICIYPDNVASLFPSSKDLREFNIQGYIGIPLNDSVGSVIGILCILTRKPLNLPSSVPRIIDIIAAKAAVEVDRFSAQEALADSEKKFRTLVEYSLDGIIIEDLEGTILFVNPAAGCILESENYRDLAGRTNVMEFISPESRAALLHDLNEASNGADGFVSRYKIITLKQNERWIEGIGKFIVFNGRPAILISARDVTDRQMAEDALSKNRQQLEDAMALTRMVEWEYHPATGLLHLNDHLFSLLCTTAEREGSSTMTPEAFAREFVHPDDRIWVVSGLAKAVESADPRYTAWRSARIVRRDGEVRDILVFVRFIPQTAREQAMLHGTIQDVTEQKR